MSVSTVLKRPLFLGVAGLCVLPMLASGEPIPTWVIRTESAVPCICQASFAPQPPTVSPPPSIPGGPRVAIGNVGTYQADGACDDKVFGAGVCSTKAKEPRFALDARFEARPRACADGSAVVASGVGAHPVTIGGIKFVATRELVLHTGQALSVSGTQTTGCGNVNEFRTLSLTAQCAPESAPAGARAGSATGTIVGRIDLLIQSASCAKVER